MVLPRFPSPLIKPDVRISRIRLSDWLHLAAIGGAPGAALMLAIGVPRSAQIQHTAHRQRNEVRSWTGHSHRCAESRISQDPKSP